VDVVLSVLVLVAPLALLPIAIGHMPIKNSILSSEFASNIWVDDDHGRGWLRGTLEPEDRTSHLKWKIGNDDPNFGSQFGQTAEQLAAATALYDAEEHLLRSAGVNAQPAADAAAELRESSKTAGAEFLDGQQNEVIEAFYRFFGPPDPFEGLPVLRATDLRQGDLLVSTSTYATSQAIRILSWGRYSHLAVVANPVTALEATSGHGVHELPLQQFVIRSLNVSVMRDTRMVPSAAKVLLEYGKSKLGARYNYPALYTLATYKTACMVSEAPNGFAGLLRCATRPEDIPRFIIDNGSFFCSQLPSQAFATAKLPFYSQNSPAPNDVVRLSDTGRLQRLGRLTAASFIGQ